MSKSIKSVAKLVTAPIKALYDPVGAIKDVFGGVQGIFAGLTGAAKVSGANSSEPSSQTVRSSKAPVRFILGRVSTGGVLAWVQEQPGDQTSGEWLHIVYVLSEGAIAGVDEIYVDERPLSELGENATSEVIIDPSQANAFLLANCPDWRQEQIGRGLSFVRLSFKYDAEKFPSGIPDVRFVVRGRSDVYDPRNGALGYSANTALLILWYLRNRCAIPDDEIIFESFASAANVCDETVIGPDNTGTRRYFAGAVIGADEKRNTVLDNLLSACAGTLIRVGGRWSLQVGAYYGPADFTINEDMVIGTVEGTTEVSNSDAINTMRGTFVDPAQAWAETDYPEVAIQDWIASDGGELAESQSFAYVTDAYLAQRLANISLRRRRSGGSLAVPLNFNGYNCRPGRAVKVDLPSLNILGEFIVTDWTMGAADACKVTLKPYEQAIFDDAVGQPYDPLGFINLPVGGLAAVTGLAWAPSGVAEVVQGVLSWTPPIQTVLSYTVTIRKGTEVVQSLKIGGEASSCNINGLTSGVYAMSVVAFGPGTRSGEASISVNVGGPPVPESCAVFASVDTITLVPANLQNSLNGGTYEYFYATNPSAPIADAVYLGQGLTFTHTGLAFAREYFYYVRAANAYGKSDFLFVPAATSSDPTQMLDVIAGQITESELGKQLTSRIDLIDMNGPGSVNDRIGTAKTELAQQISEVNNALNTTKGNLQQQITAVSTDVSAAKADLQQQIANVSALAGSLPYRKDKAYSVGQSALGSDGKLYQALKAVPLNTPPPNATYWTDVGQAVVTANGMAARVQTMETKVETLEGATSAQAQQISGLQSSLTTTNGNVSAAQQAAQDAATLAGGKGKVIVQSAAPAVADRLAQNLWIDTTSNANTPKRWSGTAWVAVTDKVATDAAAAAAGALALAQTKADATVVSSLTTRVSDAEGKLTSQATRMDGMQTSIDGKASSQALQQVTTRVAATEDKDKAQDQQLLSQSQALTSLTDSVSKKADASAVQSLGNRVEAAEGALSSQSTDITQLKNSVGAAQPFVAGRAWEFTGSTRGWVATATNGTITAGPLFATVTANPNLQCNFTPVVAGAENPYLRIRLRRRNTSRAGAQMYWANEDGGLAEARRFGWFISATTTDWQDIELDLSGHAGWNGKKIYAIRLDMMNSGDTSGEIDIAYIAVGRRSASASAEAVSTLNNAVTEAEGKLSSQSQSIVNLQGGLNATNGNVSAAQKAAQDAYSLADAKGKVIVQNSTPSAINQQIQNLWIDTTGGGNTPKRWNGSAWQAVSDKVATDAAAAAANALSQVATKADASTVQSLTNKVEQQGTAITAAGEAITGINASLGQVGGENLLPNPSFEVEGPTAGLADGWRIGSSLSAPNRLLSLVPSTLDPRGKAQRVDAKGLSGSAYVDVALPNASWVSMAPGQVLTVSAYVRGTQDLVSEIYLQYKNSGGATVGTHGPLRTILSDAWNRPVFTGAAAPAGTIGADLLLRVRGPLGGTASDGYYEIDRAQAELSTVVSAWKDNAKNAQSAAQANAAAINSVSGRVSSTEEGLTSVSGRLTQLDNSIGDVGGENLLYNPAFTKLGAATGNNPDGWVPEGTATYTPSMVSSWLNAAENAYRCTTTGVGTTASGNPYTSLVTASERAPAVAPGQTVTSSIYARKTSDSGDLGLRIFHQWANAAGAVISAPASLVVPVSVSGDRVSFTSIAPAGAAKVRVFYRAHAASGSSAAGTFEVARPQVEYGSRPTGWRDNGQVNSTTIGAVSTAVDGLTSSVSQQGKDITSVSGRTTSLENSVNNGSTGLASKASTAALTSVANRVAATESGLTAQSTSITNLEAKIGTALPFVAGQTWEFVNSVEGWIANTSGATLTAGPQYATVAKFTTIQATNTFPVIDGAANPLVRIRLRRRNTGRTSAAMYWANEDGGLAEARRFNWPISTSNGDWQDIEFDLSGHAGWNGKKIWAIRLDMYNSGDANGEVDIAYIAAGRRSVAASGRAFDSLSVNVSQQGDKLAAETQRINGLLSSVGDANAAIQNEAKARSDADGALSQQIQSTQSSLGATNASVQQISTAQTGLNNRVNAQFSIKVAVTQSGVYALGGIGVGIQNQNGVLQSVVAVLADQFAVINAAGNGYVSPFAIQGGQVFMNDAFIRDGSIINAKIANGAITSAKIGVAEIDTLRIRGNAVTVPVSASSPGNVLGAGVGQWQNLVAVGVQMDEGGFITAQYSCYQGFGSGIRKYQFQMDINGLVIAEGGGDWADGFPNLMGSIGVGPGFFVVTVKWWGENTGVGVKNHNLFAMGTKR
ncbi:phage tail protein [Pseudomonas juntendi]|uniref:phage tail protein n=1 Tax=Pseudomonas juntendi TaxID=2666183 RepID=UPI002101C4CD|nr:phage tail protein [Pseudomonas juntendi]